MNNKAPTKQKLGKKKLDVETIISHPAYLFKSNILKYALTKPQYKKLVTDYVSAHKIVALRDTMHKISKDPRFKTNRKHLKAYGQYISGSINLMELGEMIGHTGKITDLQFTIGKLAILWAENQQKITK